MNKTVVIDVVGLTAKLLKSMPKLSTWAAQGSLTSVKSAFPAVTCTAQADYLTGRYPREHGIVGNGWYSREDCEVRFWRQSNKLVQAPKIWEVAKAADPSFTCANLFWWFNMYSGVDYSVTPRPMYLADGRKLPDIYTNPPGLREELQSNLGGFPLFDFWGPRASIRSTQWIAEASKRVEEKFHPTLTLIYLPHLDYNLQRLGTATHAIGNDLTLVDDVCGDLITWYEARGAQVIVLSEYGLCDVSTPVHLNRTLREHRLLAVREELGLELLDPGASAAFAVADHQVAHVYVNDRARISQVRAILEKTPGVELVLSSDEQGAYQIDHARSGDFVVVAQADAWFTYYYWLDDRKAPDFARTVDIHRKPGYDPVELFLDPKIRVPVFSVGWRLLKKSCGFRSLMDVIPLDASLVKGSHGRASDEGPVLISRRKEPASIRSVDVYGLIGRHLGEGILAADEHG